MTVRAKYHRCEAEAAYRWPKSVNGTVLGSGHRHPRPRTLDLKRGSACGVERCLALAETIGTLVWML